MSEGEGTPDGPASAGSGSRLLVTVAAFIIVVAGMQAAKAILVPFLLSVFVAVLCGPPLAWLQKRDIPRGLAILIVILAVVGVGTGILFYAGASANSFRLALPEYQARLRDELEAMRPSLQPLIDKLGIKLPEGGLVGIFDPGVALQWAGKLFSELTGLLANALLMLLTVVFILLEASSFPDKLRAARNDPWVSFSAMNRFTENVNRYMAIKTAVSLLTGVLVGVWLAIVGVDYPVLWGLLAFLLNYIPNLGSLLAAIPAVLLAFVQLGAWQALVAAAGFLVVNVVVGSAIEPRFMGRGLGLSTLVVFLSLVFWGWVLGGMGMLLSVPLTMTLKIALESNPETRPIAVLLGSDSTPPRPSDGAQPPAAAPGPSDGDPPAEVTG